MGNKNSCCAYSSPSQGHKDVPHFEAYSPEGEESIGNLQHISEREPEDCDSDPSLHPMAGTIFMERSKASIESEYICNSPNISLLLLYYMWLSHVLGLVFGLVDPRPLKKSSSCSTIYLDDSTVSQPNLKNTVKCVALAIYYHIKNRTSQRHISIFDEKLHPLTRDGVIDDYDKHNPEHRQIYKFVRTLFNAAQLTAECAIITLVYLERLLTYAEVDITPATWKRIVLGAILLASKVWDDQAVWNVDYCQILKDITVEDMNELERQFLEMLQFNINVPSSVYAKYYFDLRTLAEANDLSFPSEPLSKDRAQKLEAMSRVCEDKVTAEALRNGHKKWSSVDNVSVGGARRSVAILS
uniref:Cyclin-like domain-containing protein n=1 Tax=Timema bartmani TaxID=61472 RepID=A0A7R9ENV9_9NEOP|nr:unnamed protein product [Timema bartmani]